LQKNIAIQVYDASYKSSGHVSSQRFFIPLRKICRIYGQTRGSIDFKAASRLTSQRFQTNITLVLSSITFFENIDSIWNKMPPPFITDFAPQASTIGSIERNIL
jgi:hypothetical protein